MHERQMVRVMAKSASNGVGGHRVHRHSERPDPQRVVKGKGNPSLEFILLGLLSAGIGFFLFLIFVGG